ncbi:MAG TPA: type II toxin-antitoxin system VapC family toxin [Terracidiphilus sp.]|jgi:predicted nucleic-acid-binding protein
MRITADTNVLLRGAVLDDPRQVLLAAKTLREAEAVAVSISALCEFVWVMRTGYKRLPGEIARSIRSLINSANVVTDRTAVEAGLKLLEAGGDFADGVIAHDGAWLGAEEFVSFDKRAVTLLKSQGARTRLLA